MIILDTQVLRGMGFDSVEARLVRVIRESKTDRVAMPWMAFEERLAQYVLDYEQAHRATLAAHRDLARKVPGPEHWAAPELTDPSLVRALWDKRLRELVEVVPTPPEAFPEALRREANLQAPAKTAGNKGGARDVAIWLTAIDYARTHPSETVYFVSGNTKDFTDGKGPYPAPMDEDRKRAGANFFHLTDLSEVLEPLASPVEVPKARVTRQLAHHHHHVRANALLAWGDGPDHLSLSVPAVRFSTGQTEMVRFSRRQRPPFATRLVNVDDIKAYQLGNSVWCTAKVTWEFIGFTVKGDMPDVACCTWTSHVMLSLTDDGPAPQIFDAQPPEAPKDSNSINWGKMPHRLRRLIQEREEAYARHARTRPRSTDPTVDVLPHRRHYFWPGPDVSSAERAIWEGLEDHDRQGITDRAQDRALEGLENWPGLSGDEDA